MELSGSEVELGNEVVSPSFFSKFPRFNCNILSNYMDTNSLSPYKSENQIKLEKEQRRKLKKITVEQGLLEKSEELKKHAWRNWMTKLEIDWQYFNSYLETEKKCWIEERESEWQEWLNSMENKWMHYNENMDNEYEQNILNELPTWDESTWETWIKTEGKKCMLMDLNKWMHEKQVIWKEWIIKQWREWKKDKILTWLLKDWRRDEFEYWEKLKYIEIPNPLNERIKKNQHKWEKRVSMEKAQWNSWVRSKEGLYYNECKKWKKLKEDKQNSFNEWVEVFINKWINKKQWNVWNEERKNVVPKEECTN
ncbi:tryptophan-rich protein [Plasmodium malariae]|uniref:Tryptophan-rich protein n=1 Tax=Plasmodium malariae TaxID=5858 RepID=A0A1D3TFR2_PLAMA|nr:tryptophan-rich protein [Plasmodium malariae]SCP03797.1 tryptophan-rich protein [Plasmodium malariae]